MNDFEDYYVGAEIIEGTSKNGKPFKAVQFYINTAMGEYKSPLCFPTSLEISLVEDAINKTFKKEN